MYHVGRILGVFSLAFVFVSSVAEADVQCGDVIMEDTTLTNDVICTGGQVISFGSDNVTLDLGGNSIISDGATWVPIDVLWRKGITIKDGTITGFTVPMRVAASENIIVTNLFFQESALAVLASRKIELEDLSVVGSSGIGVYVGGYVGGFPGPGGGGGSDDVSINNLDVHGFSEVGLFIERCLRVTVTDGNFVDNGTGLRVHGSTRVTVTDGNFSNNGTGADIQDSKQTKLTKSSFLDSEIGVHVEGHTEVQIEKNHISGRHSGCDGGCVGVQTDDDTVYTREIEGNLVHDTDRGIEMSNSRNTVIAHNRVFNNIYGIVLQESSILNQIHSNIVLGNKALDLFHWEEATPNEWKNNKCSTSEGADIPDCRF